MLDLTPDVHSLADFTRNTGEFLSQLKESGRPVVLTIRGKAELVVQDAASYQKLLALAERLETIEAVRESLAAATRGEGMPLDEVFGELLRDLNAAAG